jgi:general secretion pathway protein D
MARKSDALLVVITIAGLCLGLSTWAAAQPPSGEPPGPSAEAKGPATVTLQLKNMEIIDALRTLADKGNLNIVAEEGVKGKITLFLTDVEIMDALAIIAEMNDLAYIKDDHAIKVMTGKKYEDLYGRPFHDKSTIKVFTLKNAQAALVANQLAQLKTKTGKIVPDPRTNSLIIIDTPQAIREMRAIIEAMDMPVATRSFDLTYISPNEVVPVIKAVLTPAGRVEVNRQNNKLIITDIEENLDLAADVIAQFDLQPTAVTKAFMINYASLEQLLPTVTAELTPGLGVVYSDEKTNQVIVRDLPDRILRIEELIQTLDRKTPEVLIEARILQIALDDETKLGVQWEAVTRRIEELGPLAAEADFPILGPLEDGLTVVSGGLDEKSYEAMIEMLSTKTETNLISSPRITALNNETAQILVGSTVPYKTVDTREEQGTIRTFEKVTMVDVGVKLFVTPTINDEGFITMRIRPEVSSVTAFSDGIPIVEKVETETSVIVKDGVTIIISGLVKDEHIETVSGVPILKDIPILGIPFRSTDHQVKKSELAIFLTPHIITGDVTTEPPPE